MSHSPTVRLLEVFDSLQGEGVWTGVPMTFVRLAGCNAPDMGLACVRWCDTPASWDPGAGEEVFLADLVSRVNLPRVCLTGGEPLLQEDAFAALVPALQAQGIRVHVESNGTLALPGAARPDWLTISPKPPAYRVVPGLEGLVHEIKVVIDAGFGKEALAQIEELGARFPQAAVCLQPEASGGVELLRRTVSLVLAHPDWRLSLQAHKLLGLR